MEKIYFQVQMPVDDDNKLIVAASITQAAATLYAQPHAYRQHADRQQAIVDAFLLYADVVKLLQDAEVNE
jgi:hypothetical protein